jgi:ribulose-5-phosphate 4-epimerase/fuculose-1-phosphate aldolase
MQDAQLMDLAGAPAKATTAPATEAELRRHLAAAYRLAAHFGWDDLVANHFSARVPGPDDVFLINPYGLLFEEITASSLIKVDRRGERLDASDYGINPAGFVIHSAIHEARPEAVCVMHLHTRDGVAVSATERGILPLNQTAITLFQDIAFHDYEGIATNLEERARLQKDLGRKNNMILRNHGTLTLGESVGSAFYRMYALEWVCNVQVRTLGMNIGVADAPDAAIQAVQGLIDKRFTERASADLIWPALLRKVERLYPDYAD